MANEKRLKCCEDCIHFLACIPYADDMGADYDWQLRWAKDCDLYEDKTNRVRLVRGRWHKATPCSQEFCTNCGLRPKTNFGWLPPYCPHCGAKMDGDSNG